MKLSEAHTIKMHTETAKMSRHFAVFLVNIYGRGFPTAS